MTRLKVWCERRGFIKKRLVYRWSIRDGNNNLIVAGHKEYADMTALHDDIEAIADTLNVAIINPIPIYGLQDCRSRV